MTDKTTKAAELSANDMEAVAGGMKKRETDPTTTKVGLSSDGLHAAVESAWNFLRSLFS